jgi:hypothetical protein
MALRTDGGSQRLAISRSTFVQREIVERDSVTMIALEQIRK